MPWRNSGIVACWRNDILHPALTALCHVLDPALGGPWGNGSGVNSAWSSRSSCFMPVFRREGLSGWHSGQRLKIYGFLFKVHSTFVCSKPLKCQAVEWQRCGVHSLVKGMLRCVCRVNCYVWSSSSMSSMSGFFFFFNSNIMFLFKKEFIYLN